MKLTATGILTIVGIVIVLCSLSALTWRGCYYKNLWESEKERADALESELDSVKSVLSAVKEDARLANEGCASRISATRESYKLELDACHKMVQIMEGRDAKAEELEKDTDALVRALRDRVGR